MSQSPFPVIFKRNFLGKKILGVFLLKASPDFLFWFRISNTRFFEATGACPMFQLRVICRDVDASRASPVSTGALYLFSPTGLFLYNIFSCEAQLNKCTCLSVCPSVGGQT